MDTFFPPDPNDFPALRTSPKDKKRTLKSANTTLQTAFKDLSLDQAPTTDGLLPADNAHTVAVETPLPEPVDSGAERDDSPSAGNESEGNKSSSSAEVVIQPISRQPRPEPPM